MPSYKGYFRGVSKGDIVVLSEPIRAGLKD
jgi:hypothetical protein